MRWEGPPTCRTERSGRVNGTRGRGLGVKKGWREGKLERRRRTPVQPESAMRGGAGEIEARAEGDVVVRAFAGGKLGGGWLTCAGGGVAVEKKFDVGSVTVRMGRRVGGEFLGDRQRDEGVRPRHRVRGGRRLDRRGGKVKAVRVQTKGADKVRGVRRVRGESVVGKRLERVRVGKARGLQRRWGQSWLRLGGRRVMGLRGGKNANALSLRIKPLSLEHEGRTQFYRCARSYGIIGGGVRTIFDSLAVGGGVKVRHRLCETGETRARQR